MTNYGSMRKKKSLWINKEFKESTNKTMSFVKEKEMEKMDEVHCRTIATMIRKPCKRLRLPATTNQQKYGKNPAQQTQKMLNAI